MVRTAFDAPSALHSIASQVVSITRWDADGNKITGMPPPMRPRPAAAVDSVLPQPTPPPAPFGTQSVLLTAVSGRGSPLSGHPIGDQTQRRKTLTAQREQ